MPAASPRTERRGLLWSIAVTAAFGALGVAWGIASGSQMILFDGVYAVIGLLVSSLLLHASALAGRDPDRRYPFGRAAVTPVAIGIQGFVLLGTITYAAVEAVFTIVAGGSELTPGWAIAYGVLTTVGSVATWAWLARQATASDVLTAEATAWRVDAVRGVGMVVGFSVMFLLVGSAWDGAAAYVDPAMVLITCVASLPAPLRMVRATVVELLEGAPPMEVQSPVLLAVAETRAEFDLAEPEVRMTKLGPKLYVEVDGLVAPEVTVAQEHAVRTALAERLDRLPYDIWLNVELSPHRAAEPPLPPPMP